MSELKVVQFPQGNVGNVAAALRKLADEIDQGLFDDAHNLVWVIDRGNAKIEAGLLGHTAESGPCAYYLLGLGKRKLENILAGESQ